MFALVLKVREIGWDVEDSERQNNEHILVAQ